MTKILEFLGLSWVKWVFRIITGLGVLYLIIAGFNSVILEPIVEKKILPLKEEINLLRADSTSLAKSDSLKLEQIGQLQMLIKKVKTKAKEDSTSAAKLYSRQVSNFQELIKEQQADKKATVDSLRKAESGLRIDLVSLKYNWLGKLKDSTYLEGYRWPLLKNKVIEGGNNQ